MVAVSCSKNFRKVKWERTIEIVFTSFQLIFSSLVSIHHPIAVKLLTRLSLGLSHLREHISLHNFHVTLNIYALAASNLEQFHTIYIYIYIYIHIYIYIYMNYKKKNGNSLFLYIRKKNYEKYFLSASKMSFKI